MRHNYLNNRDILKEIHKSKNTYCVYLDPAYADYDIIVPDLRKINKAAILLGREQRAERLTRVAYDIACLDGEKHRLDEFAVDVSTILDTDVVFRVMTWDHVPFDNTKKGKKVAAYVDEDELPSTEYDEPEEDDGITPNKYTRCNFPPFQHFKVDDKHVAYLVGKSHWVGDIITGEFRKDHGQVTRTLADMYIKLCEKYGTRYNWRNYTYNDEMQSQALLQLAQVGLKFDESKSQNPFAYYTAAITNSFTRVLNTEKRNQNLRDDIMQMNNLNPSYTRQMDTGGGHYEE